MKKILFLIFYPSNALVEIVLPLPIEGLFTYSVPSALIGEIETGRRVLVPFGARKILTGIIWSIRNDATPDFNLKEIISVLDETPLIDSYQMQLWEWISVYYCCSLGEVFKAGLPQSLKLESSTYFKINFDSAQGQLLTKDEQLIISLTEMQKGINVGEIKNILGNSRAAKVIKSLTDRNILISNEIIKEGYKPKYESFVRISENFYDEKCLNDVLDSLQKAKKQYNLLISFLNLSEEKKEIKRSDLLKKSGYSSHILKALIDKGILKIYEKEISRLKDVEAELSPIRKLSDEQENAFRKIVTGFEEKEVVLLHGVMASGKTEIYIKLIDQNLEQGKQVLYLLPEIAITSQIISRLQHIFGSRTIVYHSRFSENEKFEIYHRVKTSGPAVILGVRSAVFLPFQKLGLVIVDEEHENSYKQFDPAPRYHARDTAIVLASLHKAKTLLGSATPSFESYYNATGGKYKLVELMQRYSGAEMPEVVIAGFNRKKGQKQRSLIFTSALIDAIDETLRNNEQVILFQNRRGYSPYIECNHCGYVAKCKNCDVSLTYHKNLNRLVCHHCGYSIQNIGKCLRCESSEIETKGFGTEKIEDEIKIFFPNARLARLDLDSTRRKDSYERIIHAFERHEIDILIGTQMVSKGLHFDKVRLAAVMNADTMLNFPDFRAFERSYQLMAQLSGRAGRKDKKGLVIIQTSNGAHPVIMKVKANDYAGFFREQMSERLQFKYPPYYRLLIITVKHNKADILIKSCNLLYHYLYPLFGNYISQPFEPLIARVQNNYIRQFLVKIERNRHQQEKKDQLMQVIRRFKKEPAFGNLQIYIDVDPQ